MPIMQTSSAFREKTLPQVVIGTSQYDDILVKQSGLGTNFYKKVREMRKHPTVKLARTLAIAPLLAAAWSVEAEPEAPEGAKEFIDKVFQPLRLHLLKTSLFGCMDFGFQAYEKVLDLNENLEVVIKKFKPLLQDITEIKINPDNGAFAGLKQTNLQGNDVYLDVKECLLVNIDVEGTDWYGEPDSKSAEIPYDWWKACNDSSVRYDKKIAGAHWVVMYPPGKALVDGVEKDNADIANDILLSLQSSGGICVPKSVQDFVDDLSADRPNAWSIELMSADSSTGAQFIDRLKYLDALISRAYGLPERVAMEGQFGTKAEAEAHADIAITNMELRHQIMVQQYNWFAVNHLLELNYGKQYENTVRIVVAPIADVKAQFIRDTYRAFLTSPDTLLSEYDALDHNAIRDKLGLPSMSDEAAETQATQERLRAVGNVLATVE